MSSASLRRVRLYFDVVSPYSWFAFNTLSHYRPLWERAGTQIELEPFLLGAVMAASGNKPPAGNAFKMKYLLADLHRGGPRFGVENVTLSSQFPQNTLQAMRVLAHVREVDGHWSDRLVALSQRFFSAVWANDENLGDPKTVERCVSDVCGAEAAVVLLAAASGTEAKDALRRRTQTAIDLGAFGAPWIVIDADDCFFGSDRFDVIAERLGVPWHGVSWQKSKL
jgi:glutathione S-transferase kappa 1